MPAAANPDLSRLAYTYESSKLRAGHCYGNSYTYAALDGKTDLLADPATVRYGLRESTDQRYYMAGWEVGVETVAGTAYMPATTTLAAAYQETALDGPGGRVAKRFFVPFENNWLRSAHFLLDTRGAHSAVRVRSRALFPAGAQAEAGQCGGHSFVAIRFAGGGAGALWASGEPARCDSHTAPDGRLEVVTVYDWQPGAGAAEQEFALSYAYQPDGDAAQPPLNALFDVHDTATPPATGHLTRVRLMLAQTEASLVRYLATARFVSPDPVLNRAVGWSKVNQLRDRQEYRWGAGFSNNPPSDTVVGRDSVWYLVGSSYYAQAWSKRLWDLWLREGVESNGKFVEYMSAARVPIFKDDYGLNINDNTPLFMIAAHQFYSLTGDQDFLHRVYPVLLHAADAILEARDAGGDHNPYGLVWCTSTETFVRGLCGWRNCIRGYNLSGAVTEINAECYAALRLTAEMAAAAGDELNAVRLAAAATDLRLAINEHLRPSGSPFYYLNIAPDGHPVPDVTGDLLFPVLYGAADPFVAAAILDELLGERFWVRAPEGGGGMRTVSAAEPSYHPLADPGSYGLMGGVWPNLGLWVSRAAAAQGQPDRALAALRETFLLSERADPGQDNVVPGEMPEYFNGHDLVQRGQPRSTFLFGILIWSALESFLGLSPHPAGLEVEPALPAGWDWMAVANMPYHGYPLSLLADRANRTLYTTAPVRTSWRQVVAPAALQDRYRLEADGQPFWLVTSDDEGAFLLAASPDAGTGRLVERRTGRTVAEVAVPAGGLVRTRLS